MCVSLNFVDFVINAYVICSHWIYIYITSTTSRKKKSDFDFSKSIYRTYFDHSTVYHDMYIIYSKICINM